MIYRILFFILFAFVSSLVIANEDFIEVNKIIEPSADCLILEDENSIICKFITNPVDYEQEIIVQWISPNKELSRTRNMSIPKGNKSIYDYRYIQGREKGTWTFKVISEDKKEYTTTFELN